MSEIDDWRSNYDPATKIPAQEYAELFNRDNWIANAEAEVKSLKAERDTLRRENEELKAKEKARLERMRCSCPRCTGIPDYYGEERD